MAVTCSCPSIPRPVPRLFKSEHTRLPGWTTLTSQAGLELSLNVGRMASMSLSLEIDGFTIPTRITTSPKHGAYEVKRFEGALYLFGSMPESLATPALLRLVM